MIQKTTPSSRRDWLRLVGTGMVGYSLSGWFGTLAGEAARDSHRRKSCILLWMNGGPSQLDTFDLKPGHVNGGPFRAIQTGVPGIHISEHLPKLAKLVDRLAIVRSMTSRLGDHGLATDFVHTGYLSRGPVTYPTFGSLVAKEVGLEEDELPAFVCVAPPRATFPAAYSPGFLGARYAPLVVGTGPTEVMIDPAAALRVEDIAPRARISDEHQRARLRLVEQMQREFIAGRPGVAPHAHGIAYNRAMRLMRSPAGKAFDVGAEPGGRRDAYGRGVFGQGCLLARRLVERGVPFVEVAMGGWDTHQSNFDTLPRLSQELDAAWSALIEDLRERGLLDQTLVVWMGEFGRTPAINANAGRDHFPEAYTAVLAGGGSRGGQVVGRTTAGGDAVDDRPVTVPELLATICRCLDIDAGKQNESNTGRPISIVDKEARPIDEVLS
jgi:Protein of unknown function (DUF1501)